ncbi:inositol monophosphatase [Planctomycetales bacterium]|nr:inositol monophosphatase [Planctomycetales bacterium]
MSEKSENLNDYLAVCREASLAAGKIQREKLGMVTVKIKSNPNDLVTEADTASQKIIEEIIYEAFPGHRFVGEEGHLTESRGDSDSEYCWIADPLDGTTNFVHHCPMFGPSLALVKGNDVLCGVFYNPMTEELFTASKGQGAFLNGKRIQTSGCRTLSQSLLAVGFASQVSADSVGMKAFMNTLPLAQSVRRTGSTAMNLAFIASGYFDAAWAYSCHCWDIAAGVILVQESGGVITKPNGSPINFTDAPTPFYAAATADLHAELLAAVAG